MQGEYKVKARNNRNSYTFSLRRNITILKGDSGSGKTTLFNMILDHNRYGKESGVSISCDTELIAITGYRWENAILNNPGKIIVIDEDNPFILSELFAKIAKESEHYFLLITRNDLAVLPILIDEIFELTGTMNKHFKRVYSDFVKMNEGMGSV